jgi:hypothetical protein
MKINERIMSHRALGNMPRDVPLRRAVSIDEAGILSAAQCTSSCDEDYQNQCNCGCDGNCGCDVWVIFGFACGCDSACGCDGCSTPTTGCDGSCSDFTCTAGYAKTPDTCASCTVGKFASTSGLSTCTSCAVGSYQDIAGSSFCTLCLPGEFSDATGATSLSTCTLCSSGSYQNKSLSHAFIDCGLCHR